MGRDQEVFEGGFTGKSDVIEIVYVQPHRAAKETRRVVEFAWISKWLTDKYGQGDYEFALAKTLSRWSND